MKICVTVATGDWASFAYMIDETRTCDSPEVRARLGPNSTEFKTDAGNLIGAPQSVILPPITAAQGLVLGVAIVALWLFGDVLKQAIRTINSV